MKIETSFDNLKINSIYRFASSNSNKEVKFYIIEDLFSFKSNKGLDIPKVGYTMILINKNDTEIYSDSILKDEWNNPDYFMCHSSLSNERQVFKDLLK
jgi:hypothetical protein